MTIMEIVLLIAGGIAMVLSFCLPEGKKRPSSKSRELAREEIRHLVNQELKQVKGHVEDIVEDSVQETLEQTERILEKLSNEKIMAVNEYSDTVLEDINKNHKEVMFLYDMLNDKHHSMVTFVSKVDKTIKDAEETVKKTEETVKKLKREAEIPIPFVPGNLSEREMVTEGEFKMLHGDKISTQEEKIVDLFTDDASEKTPAQNNNDRIIELYQEGLSKVEIAKELGLGVGEVKLVLDLYKGE